MDTCTPGDAVRFEIVSTARFNVISHWTDGLSHNMDRKGVCRSNIGSRRLSGDLFLSDDSGKNKFHTVNTKIEAGFEDTLRTISIVDMDYANMSISLNSKLNAHGCSILRNAIQPESVRVTGKAMQSIIKNLQKRYDRIADEFEGRNLSFRIACTYLIHVIRSLILKVYSHPGYLGLEEYSIQEALGIARCPRIGKGNSPSSPQQMQISLLWQVHR